MNDTDRDEPTPDEPTDDAPDDIPEDVPDDVAVDDSDAGTDADRADDAETADAFGALGLRAELVATLAELGYEEPTPIQRETIPSVLDGHDLVGQAATGTGKTAAFALPLLHSLDFGGGRARPTALILVPTRELAMQVSEAIFKYGRTLGVKVVPIYGGQPIFRQLQQLDRGVHVVVGTPGPGHRPHRPRVAAARQHPLGRPRRGRRDARHGLRRRHRVDPRLAAPRSARRCCSRPRCRRASAGSPRST